jgi:hypothetical protein
MDGEAAAGARAQALWSVRLPSRARWSKRILSPSHTALPLPTTTTTSEHFLCMTDCRICTEHTEHLRERDSMPDVKTPWRQDVPIPATELRCSTMLQAIRPYAEQIRACSAGEEGRKASVLSRSSRSSCLKPISSTSLTLVAVS